LPAPKHINLSEVARAVGCDPSLLNHIRAGRRRMTSALRDEVARLLNVPPIVVEMVLRGELKQ
jgi:hypothetical protein